MTTLWPHQQRAVAASTSALAAGGRAGIVAACGTGKTLIGATAATRLAARGRVLVVVPTLELLWQTMHTYRQHHGPAHTLAAVCSADEASASSGTIAVTTSPSVLAALLRADEPATVLCTYASLPTIATAHADHDLPRWDLIVVDEAHRTAGVQGKAWAAVHQDTLIPAQRRLYMTATPRIYTDDDGQSQTLMSMDDVAIYGEIVFRLGFAEAIQAGLLADYRVVVPVVTDAQVHKLLYRSNHASGADPAQIGAQIATLRAADEFRLRKIISYHHRVTGARAFAAGLPAARELLGSGTPLWSQWIAGSQPITVRRQRLQEFAEHHDGLALLANARILNEGVDVPAVDGVVFGDKKESLIDTVQAAGRALRTGGHRDKVATIIVPVFVGPGESPEAVLEASAYAPLWRTLAALRAHDDRLNEWLGHYVPRPRESPETGSGGPDLSWIHVRGIDTPEDFALAIMVRTVGVKSAEWRAGYTASRRWHRVHGDLNPPQSYVDDTGFRLGGWVSFQRWLYSRGSMRPERGAALERLGIIWSPFRESWDRAYAIAADWVGLHGDLVVPVDVVHNGFRLGSWLRNQRTRPELLTKERRRRLAALDPLWDLPFTLTWHRGLREARLYHAHHGDLAAPRTYVAPSGHNLGEWLHKQRTCAADLVPRQRDLLDQLGMDWTTTSPHERNWQRHYAAAQRFHTLCSHLEVPQSYVDEDGVRLGVWINNCRRRQQQIPPERKALLDDLGMRWGASPAPRRTGAPTVEFRPPDQ